MCTRYVCPSLESLVRPSERFYTADAVRRYLERRSWQRTRSNEPGVEIESLCAQQMNHPFIVRFVARETLVRAVSRLMAIENNIAQCQEILS